MTVWGKPGKGKWYKRQAAKARRRFGKLYCLVGEPAYKDQNLKWESECNWKGT